LIQPVIPRHARAFTLIEVMMAALILVVGYIGMIEAVTTSSTIMDHARRQTLATQIINHELEKLRFYSWSQIQALTATSPTPAIDSQFTTAVAASGATFTLTRAVADPVTNIREVSYTVQWVVTTSRLKPDGSLFTLTYTRSSSAWYGKYGLSLSYQRQ
jgi:prepilin-type N-terminal cleavage/methylation domain-containing protein